MDEKSAIKKGTEMGKEFAEHVGRLATNVMTGDAAEHLQKAGNEMLCAVNKSIEDMSIPKETKTHLLAAEKEMLLAMREFLDAALKELDRVQRAPVEKEDLKKIEIRDADE
ncbi:MAG: hypothetical protein OEV21_05680 [Thermoplasmata archaeon]|nr:hypothetical protein [Thermoplasmata archaeon]